MQSSVVERFPLYRIVIGFDSAPDWVAKAMEPNIRSGYPKLMRKPSERSDVYGVMTGLTFRARPVTGALGGRTGPHIEGRIDATGGGSELTIDVRVSPLAWSSVVLLPAIVILLAGYVGRVTTTAVLIAAGAAILGGVFPVVMQLLEGNRVRGIFERMLSSVR